MNLEEFRNLDLAEIGYWPRAAKIVVWVVMALIIWMLGYRIFIAPSLDTLTAARRQEPLLKRDFEQKSALAARLEIHPQAGADHPSQTGTEGLQTLSEVSGENEVANLLEDITRLGRANGLTLQYFKPEPERHKGFYSEVPIRIGVDGNYHQFGRFVSDLAALPRIVTVDSVHINRLSKDNSKGLKMEMVVRTYHAESQKDDKQAAQKGNGSGR